MFSAAFLVALREGLEISLILGIVFSYLRRLKRKDAYKAVWIGAASALILSMAIGTFLYMVTGDEEWSGQPYLEVIIFIIAVIILSYMTLWMKKNSHSMNKGIQANIDNALVKGGVLQLAGLAFLTVIREGLELSMFLLAISIDEHAGVFSVGTGALVGIAVASVIGWGIYRGTSKINLKLFFKVMGNILIIIAAGLLGNAVHSLIEVRIFSPLGYLYNWQDILNHHGVLGGVLHALVGYSDHLSVIQFIIWAAYLIFALTLFNRDNIKKKNKTMMESA
jgi:high-affinity iron transporter